MLSCGHSEDIDLELLTCKSSKVVGQMLVLMLMLTSMTGAAHTTREQPTPDTSFLDGLD